MSITPESDPSNVGAREYRDAFRIADELNVHGSGCVCPSCAARLPGLLVELARAIERDGGRDGGTDGGSDADGPVA